MNPTITTIIFCVLALGLLVIVFVYTVFAQNIEELRNEREDLLDTKAQIEKETEVECRDMLVRAKDEVIKLRQSAQDEILKLRDQTEQEVRDRRAELIKTEARIGQREEAIENLSAQMSVREQQLTLNLAQREEAVRILRQELEQEAADVDKLRYDLREQLASLSSLSVQEARDLIVRELESEVRADSADMIRRLEDDARVEAERRARNIIVTTIQRLAVQKVSETTVSIVTLPSEDLKGRIIGREGRNIRTFETLTGVDVIIDDTPEAVVLSSFDPIRREVARRALTSLIQDGWIHPSRIEEAVTKAQEEVDLSTAEAGESAVIEAKITGIHPELIKLIGRMRYRLSYGQNLLAHSIEVSQIAASLAAELGANVALVKRASLMHDIGKVVPDAEGSHAMISRDIILRYGESPAVAHAAGAHHNELPHETVEDVIVQLADSISAARPGARREPLEGYIHRLQKLEAIAESFPGVEKTFAVQAGREIRLIVQPEIVDDEGAKKLSHDLARRIEQELEFPGQIKVTVIREMRSIEYAR